MKGISLHWSLHPEKAKDMGEDDNGKLVSPWYLNEILNKQLTESVVARELDISYDLSVEGIVYKEFRPSHIIGNYLVNPNKSVIRFLDFGVVNNATVFAQKDELGRICFFHEIVLGNSSTVEQVEAVNAYSATLMCKQFVDYGDPSGSFRSSRDRGPESSDIHICNEGGIYPTFRNLVASNKRLQERTNLLKTKLGLRIAGMECLSFTKNCHTIIEAFQSGYRYKLDHSGQPIGTIEEIHPYEDVIDCVAGIVFEELYHLPTQTPAEAFTAGLLHTKPKNKYTGY